MSAPTPKRKRASAPQMAVRKLRILGWLQAGLSYEEIAEQEGISRARVRQIVAEALRAREEDMADLRRLNELRLAPALRLAARAIVEGRLEGIDRLVKVIDRLEKFNGSAVTTEDDQEGARQKLMSKLGVVLFGRDKPQPSAPEKGADSDTGANSRAPL